MGFVIVAVVAISISCWQVFGWLAHPTPSRTFRPVLRIHSGTRFLTERSVNSDSSWSSGKALRSATIRRRFDPRAQLYHAKQLLCTFDQFAIIMKCEGLSKALYN